MFISFILFYFIYLFISPSKKNISVLIYYLPFCYLITLLLIWFVWPTIGLVGYYLFFFYFYFIFFSLVFNFESFNLKTDIYSSKVKKKIQQPKQQQSRCFLFLNEWWWENKIFVQIIRFNYLFKFQKVKVFYFRIIIFIRKYKSLPSL